MYDVAVVGGGVVGASVAYHAARSGASVLLADRRDVGRATDAGAGIITPGGDPDSGDPWCRICGRAEAYYPDLVASLASDGAGTAAYAVCGSLVVAVTPNEQRAFRQFSAGLPTESDATRGEHSVRVTAERARALFPPLGHVEGAVYQPTAARVDGRMLADALARGAAAHGARVLTEDARALDVADGRVTAVRVGDETCGVGSLVIAGGAWSTAFADQLGARIPVVPQRGQIVHLDLGDSPTEGWPIVSGMRDHYIVPWDDHRVVVGATREPDAGFEARMTVGGIHEVLDEAMRVAPGLREATIREIRVGLRPLSADGFPILGALPTAANAFVATGHGPMGLHLGPYSGKLVADAAVGKDADPLLEAFAAGRF